MGRGGKPARRERAIELHRAGWKFRAICQAVGRSHTWLAKWLRRFHQTNCGGPRHIRGPRGVTRLFAFHTVDRVAHVPASPIHRDKRTESVCAPLVAAWSAVGVPRPAHSSTTT